MRNDYLNFRYLNPDPPIIANEEEEDKELISLLEGKRKNFIIIFEFLLI